MSNEMGDELRAAFLETLQELGGDYDASGEQRKALRGSKNPDGSIPLSFADEFPIKRGDRLREIATETYFAVSDIESKPAAGAFNRFVVTVRRAS